MPKSQCLWRRVAPLLAAGLLMPAGVLAANRPAPAAATQARDAAAPVKAAPATPAAASSNLSQVWRLAVEKQSATTIIKVETLPGLPVYSHFTLQRPDRWVLDFAATTDAMARHRWTENTKNLADVRVAQFKPTVARLVLDLHAAVQPTLTPLAHGIEISIPDAARPVVRAQTSTSHSAAGTPAKSQQLAAARRESAGGAEAAANAKKLAAARLAAESAWHPAAAQQTAGQTTAPVTKAAAPALVPVAAPASEAAAPPVSAPVPQSPPSTAEAMNRPPAQPVATPVASPAPRPWVAPGAPVATAAGGEPAAQPPAAAAPALSMSPVAAAANSETLGDAAVTPRGVAPASLREPLSQAIQGVNPGNGEPTIYTGERITLNLKDASLTDFFRLINQISGLNIIVDPSVHGSVTMVLQDVPWDQALDLVLRNNSLGRKLEGNVLYIATEKTLEAQDQEIASLKQAREAAAPLVTKVVSLSYAKASDVAAILSKKGFVLGKRETVNVDPRTNSLILHVHPSTLPAVDSLVARLDQRTPQVEIRAKVVSASRQFIRELGVQLGFGAGNAANEVGGLNSVGAGQTALNIANPKYATNSGLLPLNLNLGATAPTSGIGFINASSSFRLDAMLSAAEQKGLGHVLSQPRIITQNNLQASVAQGVRLPVQTTINNTISVQFFNVTLNLTVTPQITADRHIFLNVSVTNDAIDNGIPPVNGIPAIDTESATTNVLVANGATVVIGGVMINNNQNSVFQVPLLGDIPVIGDLFKHTVVNNQTQELLFFITPTIIGS
ncbi:MAG: type IV pilus secretin PilQ [Terriglobales bacterium]